MTGWRAHSAIMHMYQQEKRHARDSRTFQKHIKAFTQSSWNTNLFCERTSETINHNNLSLQKMSIRRMQRSWPTLMKRSKFPCRLRASFNWTRFHWDWIMLWRTFCWESWSNLFWACLSKSNIAEFYMSTLVNIKNCLLNITKAKKCKNLQ